MDLRRLAVAAALLVGGAASLGLLPGDQPPVVLTLAGVQTVGVNRPLTDGTWDLTGAVWLTSPNPVTYPVRSEAVTNGWIDAGTVDGNIPKAWTRDQWYNGADGGTAYGGEAYRATLTDTPDNRLVIRGGYVDDVEDAFDPQAVNNTSTVVLDHVHAAYIRDDAIEDEGSGLPQRPASVVLRNSLIDGTFTAFGMRPSGSTTAQNGTAPSSFTVEDSLVWVQPQPLGPLYASATSVARGRAIATADPDVWLGAYGIWKWSNLAPSHVIVRNTVFRLDVASYSSCSSQKWPAGLYENVTLVWTGAGDYATAGECANVLPPGVTLTTDVGVWDAAKAAWLAGGTPTPTTEPPPTPTTEPPTTTVPPTPTTEPPTTTVPPTPTTEPPTTTVPPTPTATRTKKPHPTHPTR